MFSSDDVDFDETITMMSRMCKLLRQRPSWLGHCSFATSLLLVSGIIIIWMVDDDCDDDGDLCIESLGPLIKG